MFTTTTLLVALIVPPALIASPDYDNPRRDAGVCIENRYPDACHRPGDFVRVASTGSSNWKFVRAKGPSGTGDVVSITKTADLQQSDPDFAGLMVRCVAKGQVDVLVVLIRPFPPQTRPQVTITADRTDKVFEGKMAAAGAAILLPDEAAMLAAAPWQAVPQLAVSVKDKDIEIKGVVALDGLRSAYANLVDSCAP